MPQPSFGSFATCSGVDDNVLASRCIIFSLSATGCRNAALYGLWIIKLYVCADTLDKSIHPTAAAGGVCVCACASCCETINNSARRSWAINTSLICGVRARSQTRRRHAGDHPKLTLMNTWTRRENILVCADECIELHPCCERVREDTEFIAFGINWTFHRHCGLNFKTAFVCTVLWRQSTLFLLEIDQCFANLSKAGCAPQLQCGK
jgi:hypothetical protein